MKWHAVVLGWSVFVMSLTLYLAVVVRVPDGPFAYFVLVPALFLAWVGVVVWAVVRGLSEADGVEARRLADELGLK